MVASAKSNSKGTTTKEKMKNKKIKTKKRVSEDLALNLCSQVDFRKRVALIKKKARRGLLDGSSSIDAQPKIDDVCADRSNDGCDAADRSSIIYLGHIPHGFYEEEIQSYFSQFGTVLNVRVARSNITGNSKGFAFIHFESDCVARIAADTMNNYLMFERILKCHVIPAKQANYKLSKNYFECFSAVPRYKVMKNKYNSPKTQEGMERSRKMLEKKVRKTAKALADAGIPFDIDLLLPPQLSVAKLPCKSEAIEESEAADTGEHLLATEDYLEIDESDDEITFKVPPNTRTITKEKRQQQRS